MKSVLAILAIWAIWLLPSAIHAAESDEPVTGNAPTAQTVNVAPGHPQVLAANRSPVPIAT